MSKEVWFIDTTVRDGEQSLWAGNMRTGMMLAIMPYLDQAGFESMEFFAPSLRMKKMAQHLGEDAFQWLKLGTAAAKNTPLRQHGGLGTGGFVRAPHCVSRLLVEMVASHGIQLARQSGAWHCFHFRDDL